MHYTNKAGGVVGAIPRNNGRLYFTMHKKTCIHL